MIKEPDYILRKFTPSDAMNLFNALSDKRVVKHMASSGIILDDLLKLAKDKFSLNKVFILLPESRKSFRWVQRKGFEFIAKTT